ncbi:hypothetical protein [Streptomyces boluensis]|uniref:Uncharacterized protein n=1 Tax=Streptomyces boluensis TaxID=1775135 RepID=A0A964UVN6_9ACTN|nr:hypothetical protein [Streptomyces boluensis]NBE56254.1 hypothetical protein [Streptomyces boluensis]
MKLRHARSIAICAVALVALTGARGSSGGGCSNSSGSSGSSSSSGGSTSGGHDDVGKDTSTGGGDLGSGGTSGSSTSGGTSGIGGVGGGKNKAIKDLKIESCEYTEARGVTARVRVTNNSDETYDYKYKITFTGPSGELLRTADTSIPWVTAQSTSTQESSAQYIAEPGDDLSKITCKLHDVTRVAG